MTIRLRKEMKKEICDVLDDYKKGEVYSYYPENKERVLDSINPHYHNQKETNVNINRIRFIVGDANPFNYIEVSQELKENMINRIKSILNNYDIKNVIEVTFDTYYPRFESRLEYASYNISLDIYVKEVEE